jgi:hypothetical protein
MMLSKEIQTQKRIDYHGHMKHPEKASILIHVTMARNEE